MTVKRKRPYFYVANLVLADFCAISLSLTLKLMKEVALK